MSGRQYDDISRCGLTEVYHPREGVEATAHIIFVHGLFGRPDKTWTGRLPPSNARHRTQPTYSTNTIGTKNVPVNHEENSTRNIGQSSQDVFWPAALLPTVVTNTRISTWGYDADIDRFWSCPSQNTVDHHAANLLADIADRFDSDGHNLPIFFVVHDLGGIIVKAAMNQSSRARVTRVKVVIPSVRGILFLGTPHRGSKLASHRKIAYQLSTFLTRRPNLKLLRAVEKNSDTLDQVGNSFLQTLHGHPELQIYSFREEKETRKYWIYSKMVVEADSGKIGLPEEELNSIPENHCNMTKFASHSDVGFRRVSAQIRRWVNSLPAPKLHNDTGEISAECPVKLGSIVTQIRVRGVALDHAKTF